MKRFSIVLAFVAAVAGVSLAVQRPARADGACGEKGQPHCPLQGWMEKNMQDFCTNRRILIPPKSTP